VVYDYCYSLPPTGWRRASSDDPGKHLAQLAVTRPETPRTLIYRDHLLPFSETFILSQANALRTYSPTLVGRRRVAGVDLAGHEVIVVNNGDLTGKVREAAYMLGSLPRDFVSRLTSLSPSILHAHFGPDAVNALPLQRQLKVPLVVTFHGYDATQSIELRSGMLAWRYGRRLPTLVDRADSLLAVSEYIRNKLITRGLPDARIRTHYIGVDLNQFSPAPLTARESVVLGVGRFVEKKGFEFLIDAMSKVQRLAPQAELVLIGSGELERELKARASRLLRSVRIFGPCPSPVIRDWMKRARLLVAPSVTDRSGNTEGLPITIIEALASGLPVVATQHAGIPEAVVDGTSGFLVPERDVTALADRILGILQDDQAWEAVSNSSRQMAERNFDLTVQTAKLEKIYAQAVLGT
jgi:colanic acid/amylovoran biosynthesis glycosyltransferase